MMNWFGFNLLSSAWMFFLIPPLVAFYFLKLKRTRLEIPSLVLWSRVLNDHRVNSPFQRFKRNILLLLQLLLLILIILAAMQPFWRGNADRVQYLTVLIDVSESMSALDKPGGISRLEQAKERVREMIKGLLASQKLCLIAFDRQARRLTDFTNNKRQLLDALNKLRVSDVSSDIEDVLRMTGALARTAPLEHVIMMSDGNFPGRTDFELSFKLDYQPLDPAGTNIGISALNAKRGAGSGGQWDVFVQIEASCQTPVAATVHLTQSTPATGAPGTSSFTIDPEPITVSRDNDERLIYQIVADNPTILEVRLTPEGFDALESDNVAYLELKSSRSLWVYAPAPLLSYRMALRGIAGVRLFPQVGRKQTTAESNFDLVISDTPDDLGKQARVYLFIRYDSPGASRDRDDG